MSDQYSAPEVNEQISASGNPGNKPGSAALGSKRASSRRNTAASTDLNRERFCYVLTALTGKTVQARLRNHSVYEGIFHSCNLEKDFSVVLTYARELPVEGRKSGAVISKLVIAGKDFLCIEAKPMEVDMGEDVTQPQGFKTDGAISATSMAGKERELEKWKDSAGEVGTLEEVVAKDEKWNQFSANEQFGVKTTYDENLYTTKLDVNAIPYEKQEEAARIAKEIEDGPNNEYHMHDDDDEEAKFGAVLGTGAYKDGPRRKVEKDEKENRSDKDKSSSEGNVRLSEELLAQHEAIQAMRNDDMATHRTKRTATRAPFLHAHSPMVSEMKGINALNLEPALAKPDDKTKGEFISFRTAQTRNQSRSITNSEIKADLENSLKQLQERNTKLQERGMRPSTPQVDRNEPTIEQNQDGATEASESKQSPDGARASFQNVRIPVPAQFALGKGQKLDSYGFQFNAHAASFTPGNNTPPEDGARVAPAGFQSGQSSQPGAATNSAPSVAVPQQPGVPPRIREGQREMPTFSTLQKEISIRSINKLLDEFCDRIMSNISEKPESISPEWAEARGPSYKEILGSPSQNAVTIQHVLSNSFTSYGGAPMVFSGMGQPSGPPQNPNAPMPGMMMGQGYGEMPNQMQPMRQGAHLEHAQMPHNMRW